MSIKLLIVSLMFLLEYTTVEKCYECNYRYLLGCISTDDRPCDPDLNVPSKTVTHFEKFESKDKMLEFMNGPAVDTASGVVIGFGLPPRATVVAAYELTPITMEQRKVGEVEVTEQRPVKIKRDEKKWFVAK